MAPPPTHHRGVEGLGLHGLGRTPVAARNALFVLDLVDAAAEADVVEHLGPLELPGIARGQPVLRRLGLPAVLDQLAEQAVVVADAIAVGGHRQAGHALHETGGQAAQPAVAQRRVGLDGPQPLQVHAQLVERRPHGLGQAEIVQGIGQQPADQELQGQVVNPLALLGVDGPCRGEPAVDDAVADGQGGGDEPVVVAGHDGILAHGIGQLGHQRAAQGGDVLVFGRQGDPGRDAGGDCGRGRCRHRSGPDVAASITVAWTGEVAMDGPAVLRRIRWLASPGGGPLEPSARVPGSIYRQ